ncbi:hypothetical protein K492DRAFT_205878 [Lichtheimia hyalospora FSU 10163]|nr:hypothetical protein K492DRAFT_205878 [Lichtheimia hyalospora FSU 10163]
MNHVSSIPTRISPDDPFQQLPSEIMIQVWSHVTIFDLLRSCMLVSRTWRNQLLQSGYLWTEVTVHQNDDLSPSALSSVSSHVQRLRIFYLSYQWLTGLHHQIMQGSFGSITHLTIMLGGQEPIEEQMLIQMLKKLGCTLKSLYCQTLQVFPDLAVVTRTCPYLESLVYKNSHGLFNLGALEPYAGQLKSLTIENHCIDDIERDQFITIISNLGRHLHAISVFPCGQECISDVQQYCPDIHTIVWNCGYPTLDEFQQCDKISSRSPSANGLRHLSIAPHHIELVVGLMERYQDTLETLHLTLVLLRSCHQLERLKYVKMKRLSSLSIRWVRDPDAGTVIAAAILDTCQESLKVLSLEKLHMKQLMHHLRSCLKSLESLRLDNVVHSNDSRLCWDSLSSHGNNEKATLNSMELCNMYITDLDLVLLAEINTLTKFTISFTDDQDYKYKCTDDGIQSFFDKTKSALRNVVLDLPRITLSTFDTLARIPSLRKVTVSRCISTDAVDYVKKRYPRLCVDKIKEKQRDIYAFC